MTPDVLVFNPFAEGYIAHGKAFTPVKHQAMLADDLAGLPQFLCQPDDVVLLPRRPSSGFLRYLEQAGFPPPEFVEVRHGAIDPGSSLFQRKLGQLRPWAWGPDSVQLLAPLLPQLAGEARNARHFFNDSIARLYSKAWSARFLKTVLAALCAGVERWLCSEEESGVAVATLGDALEAIAAIRRRGHHRVVVKKARGLAGQNAIRLWEPEMLPAQRRWLAHAVEEGRQVVVEPWLERELDFSIQLEMETRGLVLCGYTGLLNDRKGQFLGNWAEPTYTRCPPQRAAALLGAHPEIARHLQRFYDEVFSMLEAELRRAGFSGPIGMDAFVYRTPHGDCRLKPVVEINPRYTMGRLTVELMKSICPGCHGLLRLVSLAQVRREGFADLSSYASSLRGRFPMRLEGEKSGKIRQGVLVLNDPAQAQVCLALFETSPTPNFPALAN